MERSSELGALGALGLIGICRETIRVIRSICCPEEFALMVRHLLTASLFLLAHVAISSALFSNAASSSDAGAGLLRPAINWTLFFLVEVFCLCALVSFSLSTAVFCVFTFAPRYGVADDRDVRSIARGFRAQPRSTATVILSAFRVRRDSLCAARYIRTWQVALRLVAIFDDLLDAVPRSFATFLASLSRGDSGSSASERLLPNDYLSGRVASTFVGAFLLLLSYTALFGGVTWFAHLVQLPRVVPLLGGAGYLAGAVHIGAIWRVASVMSVLEDVEGFQAMHMSNELLAGKFWAAAPVFWTLDGCALAVQLAFGALVVQDRMGLGVWLRVAAGVTMAAALWAAVIAVLVAQVVVYFVCKGYHHDHHRESFDGTAAKNLTNVGRRGRATRRRR